MNKKMLLSILVVMLLLLNACGSNSVYTYIINDNYTEYITMGTSADYPPFEWPGKVDGKITIVGIDIEIAKEIAKKEGKNLRVVNKSFDFLLQDLQNEKIDFVMAGMSKTEQREKQVAFSNDYYNDGQVLLINKDDYNKFNSFMDIDQSNYKIGAQLGSLQQEIVEDIFINAQIKAIQSIAGLVDDLKTSQIHGLLVEKPVAMSYVNNTSYLAIANITFNNDDEKGFGVAVNKENLLLLESINEVIKNIKETGILDQIIKDMIEFNN